MTRKPIDPTKSIAGVPPRETPDAEGNVRAVDRALAILQSFAEGDAALPLVEIARRAGLHLTTALRLLGTLESHGFVQRAAAGGYALGPHLLVLGERFRRGLRLEDQVMPALDRLRGESQESAAFFVREGQQRRCLFRQESPQPVRTVAQVGDVAPLGIGAYGRALVALDAETRQRLPIVSHGERLPEVVAIAAPVLDGSGRVVGALGITMPRYRFDSTAETLCLPLVLREAAALTRALGGDPGSGLKGRKPHAPP
ncbi:IclR family transcriptional regulator [Paracraurococcus lichenis]|uniref:IclR family transcriptional regulator n=1 Tax=Paracraurococcus lichenis TaxID=3064888 RepID=A0ABT9EC27_9PROT|nr:IclR family transcriptional regulator [Paracraurococcus sp. LOR1-02]MDO9713773.1 IclR family transcriptional regulator [Paracraurococcus sp. LOR1-02]